MVIAYVASRFPDVSQTWMIRELDAVSRDPRIDCELLSLFPPMERTGIAHPSAERWIQRLQRPGPVAAAAACSWWLFRAPGGLLTSVALVLRAYVRRPGDLAKALVTIAIAAGHARWLRTAGVDHLHAHTATWPLLAAWMCKRLTGVPYSLTPHAHDLYVDQSFLARRLAEAEFTASPTDFNRGFLAAYGGDRTSPVYLVRYGIDLSAYRYRPRAPAPKGPVRALAVGGLKDYKGHRFLLQAIAHGGAELERVNLDLVGDGPLREELLGLAAELGLSGRVTFHGALAEPAVIELLDRADLFVLPSVVTADGTSEGLPNVLIEALAAGIPAVATRVTGVPELIRDEETGLLVEPADASALAGAIARVLADPETAKRRAEAGRSLVERNHDAERSGAQLARLFLGESPYSAHPLADRT